MNADQAIDKIYELYSDNKISQKELLNYLKTVETLESMFNKRKDNQ